MDSMAGFDANSPNDFSPYVPDYSLLHNTTPSLSQPELRFDNLSLQDFSLPAPQPQAILPSDRLVHELLRSKEKDAVRSGHIRKSCCRH